MTPFFFKQIQVGYPYMAENLELHTQMARLEERLKIIAEGLVLDRDSRKDQYEKLENIGKTMTAMDARVKSVEESFARSAPTIEEFITIKHKVVGAGVAGKWLWFIVGGLLTVAYNFRSEIFRWFSK